MVDINTQWLSVHCFYFCIQTASLTFKDKVFNPITSIKVSLIISFVTEQPLGTSCLLLVGSEGLGPVGQGG